MLHDSTNPSALSVGTLALPEAEQGDSHPAITTTVHGLSQAEVEARRAAGQANTFHLETSRTYLQILKQNALSFINIVIVVLGILLLLMGHLVDSILTAGMVVLNILVGMVQEGRAKHTLDRIALLNRPKATVIREDQAQTVDPRDIVLGDVLEVQAGDQIVVDGQVIGDGRIEVDESLLTGESDRVPKRAGDKVYSGSFCMTGRARFVATTVGAASVANQLAVGARAFRQIKTPLQRDVDYIVKLLAVMATALGILIALSFLYSPLPAVQRVQIFAIIVALVPQGLFLMVTVTYAMGALRMAGKGALIQQINAVESLSNVDVLCLDKTGTLTTNSLKVEAVQPVDIAADQLAAALGDFVASLPATNRTSEAIAQTIPGHARPVHEAVPFSSTRKWSALTFDLDGHDALHGVYVLGAHEMLQSALGPGPATASLSPKIAEWEDRGLRVLLFAYTPELTPVYDPSGAPVLPANLVPLGLLSMSDELRPEAHSTLRRFADASVQIKIISGDSPQTVAALARQVGLGGDMKVISGLALAAMNEDQFAQAAVDGTIFGRITPQQKEQLVRALRAKGHYVGMIGDGVNDVLSLKQAQLAIAMESGSQATRSVADIVLLNDSFAVLPTAVLEGRRIIRGMQDVMRLMLTQTLSVSLLIISCAIIAVAFPTTPRLRTVVTLITVGLPTLAIATWARPGSAQTSLIRPVMRFVLPAAATLSVLCMAVYLVYLLLTRDIDLARSALAATGVLCGLMLILFVEPPTPFWVAGDDLSGDWRPTLLGAALLFVFGLVMVIPPFRDFFEIRPVPAQDLLLICAVVVAWAMGLRYMWRACIFERLFSPPSQ